MAQGRGRWDRKPVLVKHQDALSRMDWRDFERLIAGYFRDQGFEVEHSGTGGRVAAFDGGVDLRLRKDGELTLVQCKRDTACQTEHNVVNELLGIKVNERANHAIVITTGEFTAAAKRYGSEGHVRLIDGIELRRMLGSRLELLEQSTPSPIHQAVERFAWQAVDHIASGPRGRRRSNAIAASINLLIAKAVFTVVGFLLLFFFATVMLPRIVSSQVQGLVPHPSQPSVSNPAGPAPARSDYVPQSNELPSPPQTPEASAAAKRRQAEREAEVKKYLERVPELTHYRYSPLDQNRDPQPEPSSTASSR